MLKNNNFIKNVSFLIKFYYTITMEYKTLRVTVAAYPQYIEEMELFEWHLDKVNPDGKDEQYVILNFSRDPNIKNYEQIRQLELEWFSIDYPKFWPCAVFCILGFALIPALLVICMALQYDFNSQPWLYALLIPGIVSINLALLYFIYRTYKMRKVFLKGDEIRRNIREKIKGLNDAQTKD